MSKSKKIGYFTKEPDVTVPAQPVPTYDITYTLTDAEVSGFNDTINVTIDSNLTNNQTIYFDFESTTMQDIDYIDLAPKGQTQLDANGNVTISKQITVGGNVNTDQSITIKLRTGDANIGDLIDTKSITVNYVDEITPSLTGSEIFSDINNFKVYNLTNTSISPSFSLGAPTTVQYVVVAGGGSGGNVTGTVAAGIPAALGTDGQYCGGGGAGGVISGLVSNIAFSSQTLSVGAGAISPTCNIANTDGNNNMVSAVGLNGSNSSIGSTYVAGGGGGGGSLSLNYLQVPIAEIYDGLPGGSGGGAGGYGNLQYPPYGVVTDAEGGANIAGQGSVGSDGIFILQTGSGNRNSFLPGGGGGAGNITFTEIPGVALIQNPGGGKTEFLRYSNTSVLVGGGGGAGGDGFTPDVVSTRPYILYPSIPATDGGGNAYSNASIVGGGGGAGANGAGGQIIISVAPFRRNLTFT